MAATDDGGHVTMTVPTASVERRAGRHGREYHVVTLPRGTRVGGHDLSGGLVCARHARESRTLAAMTDVLLPAGEAKGVRLPREGERHEELSVGPEDLRDAVGAALETERTLAAVRQAERLLETGDAAAAREALEWALGQDRGDILPPSPSPQGNTAPSSDSRHDARAYESAGILPAFMPTCAANTHSSAEPVPEGFSHVAFDPSHCVERGVFESLLGFTRGRPPRYGGALEEHSIGYVARQLARPFARANERAVTEVNGRCVDVTDDVMAIPGARITGAGRGEPARDSVDLGVASLSVDRLALMERFGLDANEADATVSWLLSRFDADVALATGRISAAHVSSLLRSPDAVGAILAAGARLENPATGEVVRPGRSGELVCEVSGIAEGALAHQDPQGLMDWLCLHVACDGSWQVAAPDAMRIAHDAEGPMALLRNEARAAYLADEWLSARDRQAGVPTREATEALLEKERRPAPSPGAPRLRDACREIRIPHGNKRDRTVGTGPRVA